MSGMIAAIPDIFYIFAGIALIIMASGYAKNVGKAPSTVDHKEIQGLKERLERIENHLDLHN
jgi:hypothetical protein